jgi:serine/threonine protein kinase
MLKWKTIPVIKTLKVCLYINLGSKFEDEFTIIRCLDNSRNAVYLCVSKLDGLQYAIKKSKKPVGYNVLDRTNQMIFDFNLLSKFNIYSQFCVRYREAWIEDSHLFIKQDYCKYGDILDLLEKLYHASFSFTEQFYWDLIFEMLCGVQYVHDCGYIHLDIKPSNFLVSEDGCIKLADFGLSKKANNSQEDDFEGDAIYMAPEILKTTKFKELNYKCDNFSVGLSILEILFNVELPQTGKLWKEIRSENFKIPDDFYAKSNLTAIPVQMIEIIMLLIHPDPTKRQDVPYLFDTFEELNRRNRTLKTKEYSRTLTPQNVQFEESNFIFSKKTSSYDNFII